MTTLLVYVFAFVVVGILDLLWVVYMQTVARGQRSTAGATAAVLYAASGLTTLAYVADPGVLVAGTLGAFAGTFVAVRRNKEPDVRTAAEVDVPVQPAIVVGFGRALAGDDRGAGGGHGDSRL